MNVIKDGVVKVGFTEGKGGRCGKVYVRRRPAFSVICDCFRYCPLYGAEMTPFHPDMDPATYRNVEAFDVEGGYTGHSHVEGRCRPREGFEAY